MTLESFLSASPNSVRSTIVEGESIPLQDDSLNECQLIDIRFDAVRSVVGILMDTRTSLYYQNSNTALIVAYGTLGFQWSQTLRQGKTAWSVVSYSAEELQNGIRLSIGVYPAGRLSLNANFAAFYFGMIHSLPEASPDYETDSENVIAAGIPGWSQSFVTTFSYRTP